MVDADMIDQAFQQDIFYELNNVKSAYNIKYYCDVLSVKVVNGLSSKEIHIGFDMVGDYSLGNCQHPNPSRLFLNNTQLNFIDSEMTKANCERGYQGVLKYKLEQELSGELTFEYGEFGYSRVLLLKL
jgi:hypothetical protein